MEKSSFIKILIFAIIILSTGTAFAREPGPDFNSIGGAPGCDSQQEVSLQNQKFGFFHNLFKPKPNIEQLRQDARAYRQKGMELQNEGVSESVEKAEIFFKQAVELDPDYADPYNDLGVIYEAKGDLNTAEQCYLKAIESDPDYLNSYSNLALLYESKSDIRQSYPYWVIRAQKGAPDDEWTKKAKLKVDAIRQSVPEIRQQYLDEISRQVDSELNNELEEKKNAERLKKQQEVKKCLDLAVMFYKKEQYYLSIDEFKKALALDPECYNNDRLKLMPLAEDRLKAQRKNDKLEKINRYFKQGMEFYQQDNLQAAKQEFDKISELTASPQGS